MIGKLRSRGQVYLNEVECIICRVEKEANQTEPPHRRYTILKNVIRRLIDEGASHFPTLWSRLLKLELSRCKKSSPPYKGGDCSVSAAVTSEAVPLIHSSDLSVRSRAIRRCRAIVREMVSVNSDTRDLYLDGIRFARELFSDGECQEMFRVMEEIRDMRC